MGHKDLDTLKAFLLILQGANVMEYTSPEGWTVKFAPPAPVFPRGTPAILPGDVAATPMQAKQYTPLFGPNGFPKHPKAE
jgi:hypothetical protein